MSAPPKEKPVTKTEARKRLRDHGYSFSTTNNRWKFKGGGSAPADASGPFYNADEEAKAKADIAKLGLDVTRLKRIISAKPKKKKTAAKKKKTTATTRKKTTAKRKPPCKPIKRGSATLARSRRNKKKICKVYSDKRKAVMSDDHKTIKSFGKKLCDAEGDATAAAYGLSKSNRRLIKRALNQHIRNNPKFTVEKKKTKEKKKKTTKKTKKAAAAAAAAAAAIDVTDDDTGGSPAAVAPAAPAAPPAAPAAPAVPAVPAAAATPRRGNRKRKQTTRYGGQG